MKVEVEREPGSVSKLQIELLPDEVSKEWDAIANSFARFAKIPGYRPGKAPRAVIDKRFRKEIQDELTKKLVSKSYHEAIEQEQLRVASLANIEDIQFGDDKSMRFRATVVTAPEFDLPQASPTRRSKRRWSACAINLLILSMFRIAVCKWEILR
jgi:trigger factor